MGIPIKSDAHFFMGIVLFYIHILFGLINTLWIQSDCFELSEVCRSISMIYKSAIIVMALFWIPVVIVVLFKDDLKISEDSYIYHFLFLP
jgi:small-conductance mechanosensitive channel